MAIQIDEMRISGFRGLENIEVSLPRIMVLIGTNNSGKTSLIKALQLALGDYFRYVTDEDFHIDNTDKRCDQILVDIRIVAVDEKGDRQQEFDDEWAQEFEDRIRAEPDGKQFHAIRTVVKPDHTKGGFSIERYVLDMWPEFKNWLHEKPGSKSKFTKRYDLIPFISIDAQRDIHTELNEKSSFVGRVLSSIQYAEADVKKLEAMIEAINSEAVKKSEPLKALKGHLDSLNESFGGTGNAEVTPFPKKIRDLSKRFSVHFGDTPANSFSMEYHGMGTRSWASMLAVKAFTELMANKHQAEAEPFFPILAAEEPEAHLHPNAQRSLFKQLVETKGQVIISTHSPYLSAMCNLNWVRSLVSLSAGKECRKLTSGIDKEDVNVLHREVLRNRGEILFAKAIILFEGVTEEQFFPSMFEQYFGCSPFSMGVNMMSVSGKNYSPFVKLAVSFGIPVFIVGDNDGNAKENVEAQIAKIPVDTDLTLSDDIYGIDFLGAGNDIEAELISVLNLREEVIEALIGSETRGSENAAYVAAKTAEINALSNDDLLKMMRDGKASYAGFLSEVISRNPQARNKEELVPAALIVAFNKVKEWLEP